jgi:hypothetical protein
MTQSGVDGPDGIRFGGSPDGKKEKDQEQERPERAEV